MAASRSVAVFIGPHQMGRWQQRERAWALDRLAEQDNFPVVPVLLPGCEPPLGFMKQLMWIDLRDDPSSAVQLDALAAAIRGEQVDLDGRPEPRALICPYRGLLAFREEDAEFFFGRDDYLQQLIGLVERQPLVAIVGASGSGKSSLVSAGLIPQLRKHGSGPVWDVVRMVPHVDPLYSLAEALVPLIEPELSKLALERELNAVANDLEPPKPTIPLWGLANAVLRQQPGTERLLLFVDQWEELYTACEKPKRRERFIAELLEATARKDSPLRVVLTVRGDFYGEILQDRPLLDRIKNGRLDLGPMKPEELRAAIEGPAHNVGLAFQDGLVDRILQEAGEEPGRLPLLEFALEELWKRRDRAELTHAGYEDLGRDPAQKEEDNAAAKTGCLSRAIVTYAESVFGELEPDERQSLPALFRKLVRAGAKTEDDTRRRVPFTELDETAQRVARKLADKRLLITTRSGSGEQAAEIESRANDRESDFVEVAHEQLLRSWGRLKQWINEDRQFLLWRSRIDLKVEEFGRDGNSALLSGKSLHESKNFFPARQLDLEENQRGFLDASFKAERKRKRLIWGSVCLTIFLAAAIRFAWHRSNQQQQANSLVKTLVGTRAASVEPYLEQLESYKDIAVPMLRDEFANADRSPSERSHAAYALVRFDAAVIDELTFLLDGVSTLPKDEGEILNRALATAHGRQPLNNKLKQLLDRATSDRDRGRYAALALWLGITDGVTDVCELKKDPASRTALINDFKEFPGDLTSVVQVLDTTEDRNLRSALCLAIGTLGVYAAEETGAVLRRLFVEAPDAGTHSAAGWALRQQGLDQEELLKLARADRAATDGWFVNGQGMTMVRIPAGTFEMGSRDDAASTYPNEKPVHPVTLTKRFWLSEREVTVDQFLRFVEDGDKAAKPVEWERHDEDKRISPTGQHPIQMVSWLDAVQYCNWLTAEENKALSEEEKLTAYYDDQKWEPVPGANGYRLPTEAEWEYACRAGSNTAYCFGENPELLAEYAVYEALSTAVCASKLPNAWGLFDMHGNVFEWCADWYDGEYYARSPHVDPPGPELATSRVVRGGSYRYDAEGCRSAYRSRGVPGTRQSFLGFRVAAVPPSQQARNKSK